MMPLHFLSEISKFCQKMKKIFFEILVQTVLVMGEFWRNLKITPKSALLCNLLPTLLEFCIQLCKRVFWKFHKKQCVILFKYIQKIRVKISSTVPPSQCPRTDLKKRFLPRPKTITAWKLIPHRSKISKNWNT